MTGRATPKKERPKVVLVMIVKDEAPVLSDRLPKLREWIDGWCIVDTGSTDRTIEIAQQCLADLPGHVYTGGGWHGFADARNRAVHHATEWAREQGGEWWALLLDADTIFHADRIWRKALVEGIDGISCAVEHGSIRYWHPRVLKLGERTWRWRGVLHEYLEIPPGAKVVETTLISVEHGSGGARSRDPDKFRKDALLLAGAREQIQLDPEHEDADLEARYLFYEAQSWRDYGSRYEAEACYLARTRLGGFFQEVYISWLRVGELRMLDGELVGAFEAWTRAWGVDPSRAEALVGLASILRAWESWGPAYHFGQLALKAARTSGGMFADQTVGWKARFEVSVSAWYVGQLNEGRDLCEELLADSGVPEGVKVRTRANLVLYQGAISARALAALR